MNQRTHDTINNVCSAVSKIGEAIPKTIEKLAPYIVALIKFSVCVALCVVPFVLMHHPEKNTFWYSLAAYGIYLVGVANILGR